MSKIISTLRDAITGKEQEFTTGSINRAIILLSIPMVLEMLMEGLFALVDAFFVAKVSVNAVATVGLTESVITLVYSLAIGLSAAATAMVARRVGEAHPAKAAEAAVQAIFLATGISVVIGVTGFIFSEDILRLMGGNETLIRDCSGYTKIMFGSNIVIMLIFLFNAVFRGAGNAAYAMWVLWLSNCINIVLDPMLIFGIGPFPELGVQGAAVATAIGRTTGVALQLYLLFRGVGVVKLAGQKLRLQWRLITRLVKVAAGGTGQYLIMSASWIFLMRIIAQFGSESLAGYTIALRIIIFTFMPVWGLSNAAATLTGQNLGAGKPERAEISSWRTAHFTMFFLLIVSVVLFTTANWTIPLFNTNPEVIKAGILTLKIFCASYVLFAYGLVFSQSFNGAGDTRTPTLVNFICFWLMEIPFGYFFAMELGWGLAGVCWAVAISEAALSVIFIVLFRRGKWKLVKI
ncbi:MAG: MATE family efflux transporter [Saprospiraceae bacterium]|nr:MAG: MATE family efflux transporter [Saprospiraceae bacterium]